MLYPRAVSPAHRGRPRAKGDWTLGTQITLRHLRSFVAVAQTGSFTLAAQKLHKTQSSLTATIKQLEELSGVQLFDRTTRRVELTQDAVWFRQVAERLLHDFDNVVADLDAVARSGSGHIKISVAPSMLPHVLAPTLVAFRRDYPDVAISVYDDGSDKIERAVLEGTTDFGLSTPLNRFADLDYTPVLADRFGAVFPRTHPLAQHEGPLTWADLQTHEYVGLTKDTGIGALIHRQHKLRLGGRGSEFDYASSTTSLYALLKLGDRFTVLPWLAARTGQMSEFEFRELSDPVIEREICLITRQLRSFSPSTRRFLETLITTIRVTEPVHGARLLHDDEGRATPALVPPPARGALTAAPRPGVPQAEGRRAPARLR